MNACCTFYFQQFNVSHEIRSLSFGVPLPNVQNPLDGTNVTSESGLILLVFIDFVLNFLVVSFVV